jgi:hypothetical protein
MKRWITMMVAVGTLFLLGSCFPSQRMVDGYGYYDPMYYGPGGVYYYPGVVPRNNVIIQNNKIQRNQNRRVAPRSNNRNRATTAPKNQRSNTHRSTVQPRSQRGSSGNVQRRSTPAPSRSNVAPRSRSGSSGGSARPSRRGN